MSAALSHPEASGSDVEWKAELVVLNPLAELPLNAVQGKTVNYSSQGWKTSGRSHSPLNTSCLVSGLQSPQTPHSSAAQKAPGGKRSLCLLAVYSHPLQLGCLLLSSSSTRPGPGGVGLNHNHICIIHFTFLSSAVVFWTCQVASWPHEPRRD